MKHPSAPWPLVGVAVLLPARILFTAGTNPPPLQMFVPGFVVHGNANPLGRSECL